MTPTCFFEYDPRLALWRRAEGEAIGTARPPAAAVRGGLAAERSRAAPALVALLFAASISGVEALGGCVALGILAFVGIRDAEMRP